MPDSFAAEDRRGLRALGFLPPKALIGFLLAIAAVVLIAWFSYQALANRTVTAERVQRSAAILAGLEDVLSAMKDAVIGQRSYLITGEVQYLDPYAAAKGESAAALQRLQELIANDDMQRQRFDALRRLVDDKFAKLEETIRLRRSGDGIDAAARFVDERGRLLLDRLRGLVRDIEIAEQRKQEAQQREWRDAADRTVWVSIGGGGTLFVLIVIAAIVTSRDYRARETETWVRRGQAALAERLLGEQGLQTIGENALGFLSRFLDAPVGAVYVLAGGGRFQAVAAQAPDGTVDAAEQRLGEGLVGQAVKDRRLLHLRNLPSGYLSLRSGLGRGEVAELVILPASIDGVVQAVIELGFLRAVGAPEKELLQRAAESFALAVRTAKDRARAQELLEETQQQAEELQTQQEELRVSNEELEEQSRALKASRAQLENQQSELEQTNAQLEEFAQQLERQRDELARSQVVLIDKAAELERANGYKSEFLANMSHELRTPLNSTLILAKLLADNKPGNLTEEQVKFAQTIASAGKDLLAIINDILDLAKIEAGRVEVNREKVNIGAATDALVRTFRPVAQEKGLALECDIRIGTPVELSTDPLRLGQILRNLLSNAIKFTDRGRIELHVSADDGGHVMFAVHDTGIGIAEQQQDVIFEAFRQADGSMHRKYGGTGLGLSISRDLARLLGGDITVRSTPGKGSIFQLALPLQPADDAARGEDSPKPDPQQVAPVPSPAVFAAADDRDSLAEGARCVLVIEDDPAFAALLRDVAHETGFACVVAHTGAEGLASAQHFRPAAILLDIKLPDQSGLGVLDQLKRDPSTRHIPVHVVSGSDYTRQALERGAIGYAIKPVPREQLVDALRQMEARSASRLRSVLVVEDNAVQRESVRQLLEAEDVDIVGVDSAGAALQALQSRTFDCMVLDFNLPDMSGYALLQKMSECEDVAFPPVIVYTGRALTRDEEQSLRRFSRSIIIKDARSPERLLDEVTLFLHQMESALPPDRQRMLRAARDRDAVLEGRRILIVEDDVRNIFAVSSVLEPKGATIEIARNGREAIDALARADRTPDAAIDLVLMDIMMPEMDGFTAMREIRKRPVWSRLPIIALTAKAMKDDQEKCLAAGANDYIAKPLDVDRLLSLVRIWMPR